MNRIEAGNKEHRDGGGDSFGCLGGHRAAGSRDDRGVQANQLCRQSFKAIVLSVCPAEVNGDIFAVFIACVAQRLPKGVSSGPTGPGDVVLRNPTTGLGRGCARARNGAADVAPATSAIKSRRLITPDARHLALMAWTISFATAAEIRTARGLVEHLSRSLFVIRRPLSIAVRRGYLFEEKITRRPPVAGGKCGQFSVTRVSQRLRQTPAPWRFHSAISKRALAGSDHLAYPSLGGKRLESLEFESQLRPHPKSRMSSGRISAAKLCGSRDGHTITVGCFRRFRNFM